MALSGHGIQISYRCNQSTSHYAVEKGMLKFKIEGENRNYICSVLKIFYNNSNAIYITILEIYLVFESCASNMPH
jgi:hypothetical protein